MSTESTVPLILSIASVGVAGYAVVLSKRALTWQQQRDRDRLVTRLRVEIEHAALPARLPRITSIDAPVPKDPLRYAVTAAVVNDGESTEYIRELHFENDQGYGLTLFADEHRELPPRARVTESAHVSAPKPDSFSFETGPFYAVARTAGGTEVRSEVVTLDEGLLDHVRSWNESC